jgi:hypothetical protein
LVPELPSTYPSLLSVIFHLSLSVQCTPPSRGQTNLHWMFLYSRYCKNPPLIRRRLTRRRPTRPTTSA